MWFPADVQGVYDAEERDVGVGAGGKTLRRSVSAWVQHNRILFIANKPPVGEEQTEVVVFSNNKEPTGYDSNNPDEWKSGNTASVTIDHSVNAPKDTPIVFTSLKKEVTRKPAGGAPPEKTPLFTFQYTIPLFGGDQLWEFTKTNRPGGVKNWSTPAKDPINLDPDDPDPDEAGGMDSNLIMLAVVLMVAAALAVNM